jgi:hypothetical protein
MDTTHDSIIEGIESLPGYNEREFEEKKKMFKDYTIFEYAHDLIEIEKANIRSVYGLDE